VFAKNTGPRPVKPPLRDAKEWFTETGTAAITFRVAIPDESVLADLFAMTPYRWHAPIDIDERLAALASAGLGIFADVQVTTYKRNGRRWAAGSPHSRDLPIPRS
jgi:hypothetical protein